MRTLLLAASLTVVMALPAAAQRLAFERTFPATAGMRLEITTDRGAVELRAGEPGRVEVHGAATVRLGLMVPADAVEIARRVAAQPPIDQQGHVIRVRLPREPEEQRAVTMSYQVRVPPGMPVDVVTQSGAVIVDSVTGATTIRTGSGSIRTDRVAGALDVTTQSSGITVRESGGSLRVRTGSGAIDGSMTGDGAVDVETGSSAIQVRGAGGRVAARSRSGRITIDGAPTQPWEIENGSGAVDLSTRGADFDLDADTDASSVRVDGASVAGRVEKQAVSGTVNRGGPLLRVRTRSGAIRVRVTR